MVFKYSHGLLRILMYKTGTYFGPTRTTNIFPKSKTDNKLQGAKVDGSPTRFWESDRSKSTFNIACQADGTFDFDNSTESWPVWYVYHAKYSQSCEMNSVRCKYEHTWCIRCVLKISSVCWILLQWQPILSITSIPQGLPANQGWE